MKIFHIFDAHNYENTWDCFKREAVRAIIFENEKIALVKSGKYGYYKFPGGGIETNETHTETIVRETLEETGLHIIPQSVREFGSLIERRKSKFSDNEIFEHHSYYYFAEIRSERTQTCLTPYEAELDFCLEFADLESAWKTNLSMAKKFNSSFLLREAYILELLNKFEQKEYP